MSTILDTVRGPAFANESRRGERTINADAVADARWSTVHTFVVADGVGDSTPAASAALVAAQVAATSALHTTPVDAVLTAQEVLREQRSAGDCVLVVAKLDVPCATYEFAWVGDCRAYFDNGRVLEQVTADHTVAPRLAEAGLTVGARLRHAVTDSVIAARRHEIGRTRISHARGRVSLCSDAVHNGVGLVATHRILATARDAGDCAAALVAAAARGGSADNATALVIESP